MALSQRIKSIKMPMWLKWFLSIVGLSLIVPILGSSGAFLLTIIVGVLILFPGKDPQNPTLFKILPWLWALNWLGSIALAWNKWGTRFINQPEIDRISGLEIAITLIWTPVLFACFVKRIPRLRQVLVVSAVLTVGASLINGFDQSSMEAWLDTLGTFITEAMVLAYAWKRV